MITFYYSQLSPNARRVWLALLEKNIPFQGVPLHLNGDQKHPDFLALNPFHQVPVLVDGDFTLLESVAILDYLEARYPHPALLPSDPAALGTVRMVQMLVDNKLFPAATTLLAHGTIAPLAPDPIPTPSPDSAPPLGKQTQETAGQELPPQVTRATAQMHHLIHLLARSLGDSPYFGRSPQTTPPIPTLADLTLGTALSLLPNPHPWLQPHPNLMAWWQRLQDRPCWQQIHLSPAHLAAFQRRVQLIVKLSQRHMLRP